MSTESPAPASLRDLAGTYTIDPDHSRIGFVARHAMISKVRGSFNQFSGTATIGGDGLAASSVRVEIDAASIDTRNAQRDEHLRSGDFLSLEEHPTITFTSTGVRPTGDDSFELTGDLSIKGTTNAITVPFTFGGAATDPFGNERVGFEGSVVINRKDYGITWNATLETGGVLVGDNCTLEFEVSAIRDA